MNGQQYRDKYKQLIDLCEIVFKTCNIAIVELHELLQADGEAQSQVQRIADYGCEYMYDNPDNDKPTLRNFQVIINGFLQMNPGVVVIDTSNETLCYNRNNRGKDINVPIITKIEYTADGLKETIKIYEKILMYHLLNENNIMYIKGLITLLKIKLNRISRKKASDKVRIKALEEIFRFYLLQKIHNNKEITTNRNSEENKQLTFPYFNKMIKDFYLDRKSVV